MAKPCKKQVTARASQNQLQRRFRDYAISAKVEDIHAENVTEDELVEMVKFVKKELLQRYKKYNLPSTRYNLLKIREIFDLDREVEQLERATDILIQHLEVVVNAWEKTDLNPDKKQWILGEAKSTITLGRNLLKSKK